MSNAIRDWTDITRLSIINKRLFNFGMEILSSKDKEFLNTIRPNRLMNFIPRGMKLWEIFAVGSANDLTEVEKAKLVLELNEWGGADSSQVEKAREVLLGAYL